MTETEKTADIGMFRASSLAPRRDNVDHRIGICMAFDDKKFYVLPDDLTQISDEVFEMLMSEEAIFGDNFDLSEIKKWYEDEKSASFACYEGVDTTQYHALNWHHGFRFLSNKRFDKCLAIGVADGIDVEPLAPQIGTFYCVEPEEKWWRSDISGTPSVYRAPSTDGNLSNFNNCFFDLAIALSCLHHIPNVTSVISEIGRTVQKGGYVLLREPITMMGDWRFPRPKMTRRERGLPPKPFIRAVEEAGFELKSVTYFDCPLIARGVSRFGIKPFNNPAIVVLDKLMCYVLKWNMHYRPSNILQKVAPSTVFIVAQKK
jgi:SAM-dependent methyltransferase